MKRYLWRMNLVLCHLLRHTAVISVDNHPVGVGAWSSMGSLETVCMLW